MSDNKKYYYLKLKDNFYNSDEIKLIESMPNGYEYSSFYLKLCLMSLKDEGRLIFKGRIPYKPEMLATITGHNLDVIRVALDILVEMELIEILDTGAIYLKDIQDLVGTGSSEAERKKRYRRRIEEEKKNKLIEMGQSPGHNSDILGQSPGQSPDNVTLNVPDKIPDNVTLKTEVGQSPGHLPPEIEIELEKENILPDSEESGTEPEFYPTKKKRKLTGQKLQWFNKFWDVFSWKQGKAEAADAWLDIPSLTTSLFEEIIKAAKIEAENRYQILEKGSTPKWALGWISGRRWEDEVKPLKLVKKKSKYPEPDYREENPKQKAERLEKEQRDALENYEKEKIARDEKKEDYSGFDAKNYPEMTTGELSQILGKIGKA